jgi:hypothetical protein
MTTQKPANPFLFSAALTLVFFLISMVAVLHHEIWLDEAHSFLIAKASDSFPDLIQNSRQEGHPMLWYVLLWVLTKISHDVFYMQLLHILISCCAVFLMSVYAPMNKLKKVLFAFSYYFFFEYNILSRNYGLCILFVTLYCILICRPHKNMMLIFSILALLANTHFLGLLLSGCLVLTTLLIASEGKWYTFKNRIPKLILPGCILLVAWAICIQHVLPEETSMFLKHARPEYLSVKRWSSFTVIAKGLFQFPYVDGSSWNTNIFTQYKLTGFILTVIVTLVSVKSFFNKPISFVLFFSSVIAFSVFFFAGIMHDYTVRHWGFIFLTFYAAIWLAEGLDQQDLWNKIQHYAIPDFLKHGNECWRNGLLYSALVVQVAASVYMFVWDFNHYFCTAKPLAAYVEKNNYSDSLIIVTSFTSGPALSAYLDKPLYYPEYHGYGTYGIWSTWPVFITYNELMQEVRSCEKQGYDHALLILNNEEHEDSLKAFKEDEQLKIDYLKTFDGGFKTHDAYRVFLVTYK